MAPSTSRGDRRGTADDVRTIVVELGIAEREPCGQPGGNLRSELAQGGVCRILGHLSLATARQFDAEPKLGQYFTLFRPGKCDPGDAGAADEQELGPAPRRLVDRRTTIPTPRRSSTSPDGPRTYGELAGGAHQLVHLFRSLGARAATSSRRCAGNGVPLDRGLARMPGGGAATSSRSTPTSPRPNWRRSWSTPAPKVLVIEERVRRCSRPTPTSSGSTVLAVGTCGRVRSTTARRAPDDHAARPPPGGLFVYTSGTTGKPKGDPPRRPRRRPGQVANDAARVRPRLRLPPVRRVRCSCRPGCSTAARTRYYMGGLNVGAVPRDHAPSSTPRRALRLIERASSPHRLHGPHPVPPVPALPGRSARRRTTSPACTRSSTPPPPARGR